MLLGILVFVLVLIVFGTCFKSRRRVRKGQQPIYGTGWMVPPSYYQSQQQYNHPAPPYNPNAGQADAGYYDQNGNFVSQYPQQQPQYPMYGGYGYQQPSNYRGDEHGNMPADTGYAPPSHPPPAHVNEQAQGSNSYEMGNYPPPSYPPPKN